MQRDVTEPLVLELQAIKALLLRLVELLERWDAEGPPPVRGDE